MRQSDQPGRPQRKPTRLPLDAYSKPGSWYFVTICCHSKRSVLGPTPLREVVRQILMETAARNRVELAAYTILPDHVHFICSAGQSGVIGFVREFKSRTAREISRRTRSRSLWQRGFFDHKIRSEESLREKCLYVWMNPVRRQLVRHPEEYPWSGACLSRLKTRTGGDKPLPYPGYSAVSVHGTSLRG